jgi:UDP-glucuronate decarboxylase
MPVAKHKLTLLESELEFIVETVGPGWEGIRNGHVFMTGATGFFGCWMLQSLLYAIHYMDLGTSLTLLVRDRQKAISKMPYLEGDKSITLVEGDITNFTFPKEAGFSHVVHMATTASSPTLNTEQPLQMYSTIVKGTEHILNFCAETGVEHMLYVSSGAVYGPQLESSSPIQESANTGPELMAIDAAYAEGKRAAELLCAIYGRKYAIDIKIARCFSFYGPCMALNNQHAFGNFIEDVLHGRDILIKSDGGSVRSYLYSADLSVWLWQILFQGKALYPYNVGSEHALDLKQLARLMASFSTGSKVKILGETARVVTNYVPSTERARNELGLKEYIGLEEGIRKTLAFCRIRNQEGVEDE